MPSQFAVLVDPDRYDVKTASRVLDHDTWTVQNAEKAHVGDRILFWQTKNRHSNRGIVAFGVVTEEAAKRVAPPESRPYFRDPFAANELQLRIVVRYVAVANVPMWLGQGETGTLSSLTVSRGRGRSLFNVTTEQWDAVVAMAGGWPHNL